MFLVVLREGFDQKLQSSLSLITPALHYIDGGEIILARNAYLTAFFDIFTRKIAECKDYCLLTI